MNPLCCPKCGLPLKRDGTGCFCERGHRYDFAKSGYVNLLLANAKHSQNPGDDKRMVNARRSFLEKGYYNSFAQTVCRKAVEYTETDEPVVLDVGCGEGYYTEKLFDAFVGRQIFPQIAGIDISKAAVEKGAKRGRNIQFAVASAFHLPVLSGACSLAVNLFAPLQPQEIFRILKPGGIFLLGIPDRLHLWELKQAVYERPYANEVKDKELAGFSLKEDYPVEDWLLLDSSEDIQNLFQMTPYYYKTSRADQERLSKLTSLKTRIQFRVLVYEREES